MNKVYDQLALPRCPATSLRLPIGAWEYRVETNKRTIDRLLRQGWKRVKGTRLLKYTHREVIQ